MFYNNNHDRYGQKYNNNYEEGSTYTLFDDIGLHPMRRDPITLFLVTPNYTLHLQSFQSSNSQSKPFNIMVILKCACRSNFIFFRIFLLFIKYLTKSIYSDH